MSQSTLSSHWASFEWVSLESSRNLTVDELWKGATTWFPKIISFPLTPIDGSHPWKRSNYFRNSVLHTRERQWEESLRRSSLSRNESLHSNPLENDEKDYSYRFHDGLHFGFIENRRQWTANIFHRYVVNLVDQRWMNGRRFTPWRMVTTRRTPVFHTDERWTHRAVNTSNDLSARHPWRNRIARDK